MNSRTTEVVYCLVCRLHEARGLFLPVDLMNGNTSTNQVSSKIVTTHKSASSIAVSLETKNAGVNNFLQIFARSDKKEKIYWGAVLKRVVSVVKFLHQKGLPLCGDNELFVLPHIR